MTAADIEQLRRQVAADEAWLELVRVRPSLAYKAGRARSLDGRPVHPLDNGQLQFHRAAHVVRQLAPGNGWGKTATVAVECDWWGWMDHPWQPMPIHRRPPLMLWLCQTYKQWGVIRRDIEAWWPPSVVASWVGSPLFQYRWPTGARLSIFTAETDWKHIQGIQPDLVIVDEKAPVRIWNELMKRRRGRTRTKFCLAATATDGIDWMYAELYKPWRAYHEKLGIGDERAMMRSQLHRFPEPELAELPGIWCWPKGGHDDNPTATAETWAFYRATTSGMSDAEREVRLRGGFRDFAGKPVFSPWHLEHMRQWLLPAPAYTGRMVRREAP